MALAPPLDGADRIPRGNPGDLCRDAGRLAAGDPAMAQGWPGNRHDAERGRAWREQDRAEGSAGVMTLLHHWHTLGWLGLVVAIVVALQVFLPGVLAAVLR